MHADSPGLTKTPDRTPCGLFALLLLATFNLTGCSVAGLATADRYAHGLVVVLPGIEGRSIYNVSIARGLAEGNVPNAIEIFDWGTGTPGAFLVNLTAIERNRRQGQKLAQRIVHYQDAFPHRPVHLIGHSGGAGIVILALDALPNGREVTAAYLLAAAVSPDHDLTPALEHTKLGIWNFYSPRDIGFLAVGTSVFGTIDRAHATAAGAVGFRIPSHLDRAGRDLYDTKLHHTPYNKRMAKAGCDGSHFGWARPPFVRNVLAPMIIADTDAVRTPRYAAPSLPDAESSASAPAACRPTSPAPPGTET